MEELRIGAYGIQRDDKVAINGIAFALVEGNDVGVVVVPQILAVYGEDMLVVAKQIAHLADLLAIGSCHATNPSRRLATLDVGELDVFG